MLLWSVMIEIINAATSVLTKLLPVLVSLAALAFLFGVVRYFLWNSDSESGREQARLYIVWSVAALVIILGMWGIMAILFEMFGFGASELELVPCPDYLVEKYGYEYVYEGASCITGH